MLSQLQKEQLEWSERNFPDRKPYHPVLGVAEEAGELCHAVLKMEQNIRGSKEEHLEEMKDAIGDIVIFLSDVCNQYGFNFEDCVTKTWEIVKKRDWSKLNDNV